MAFDSPEQFAAAAIEAARTQIDELRRIREAVEEIAEHVREARSDARPHASQLALSGAAVERIATQLAHDPVNGHANGQSNGHGPRRARRGPAGDELPRGISWDDSGGVYQVDVTLPGRPRRRVRVPLVRFGGRHDLALAEACRVRCVLQDLDPKANLAALHADTTRDVALAMAK